jgi:hypothetical protein
LIDEPVTSGGDSTTWTDEEHGKDEPAEKPK